MKNYMAWHVNRDDFPREGGTRAQLEYLCRFGILAPSVHNSQPWNFHVTDEAITVSLEASRKLGAGDPTGRESWISIGACLENLLIAGQYFGAHGTVAGRNGTSVTLGFTHGQPDVSAEPLVDAMAARVSNRNGFSERPVDEHLLEELSGIKMEGVEVVASNDPNLITLLADLTGRAIGMALGNPDFRGELSSLVRHNWTKSGTGMPGFSLGVSGPRSVIESRMIKHGAVIASQPAKERRAMEQSGGVVLVFAEGDSQPYWLAAGRAYQRANLVLTARGLSCSTTAAVVEAADYHLDIERYLHQDGRLQTVTRMGYAKRPVRHSPRLSPGDVVTSSS